MMRELKWRKSIIAMPLYLICIALAISGCNGANREEAAGTHGTLQTDAPAAEFEKLVDFEALYSTLPERVVLPYDEDQIVPWRLDADVIVPQNLRSANILTAVPLEQVVNANWSAIVSYFASADEQKHVEQRDDVNQKFYYNNGEYVKKHIDCRKFVSLYGKFFTN